MKVDCRKCGKQISTSQYNINKPSYTGLCHKCFSKTKRLQSLIQHGVVDIK